MSESVLLAAAHAAARVGYHVRAGVYAPNGGPEIAAVIAENPVTRTIYYFRLDSERWHAAEDEQTYLDLPLVKGAAL